MRRTSCEDDSNATMDDEDNILSEIEHGCKSQARVVTNGREG
jgi:hypothetical protein